MEKVQIEWFARQLYQCIECLDDGQIITAAEKVKALARELDKLGLGKLK